MNARTKVAKTAIRKATASKVTIFRSLKTNNIVTEAYAQRNPTKVVSAKVLVDSVAAAEAAFVEARAKAKSALAKVSSPKKLGATAPAKKAVKKKTRLVKRNKSDGHFAKKNARGGNVRCDFIDAVPTPRKARKSGLGKTSKTPTPRAVAKVATKRIVKTASARPVKPAVDGILFNGIPGKIGRGGSTGLK